MRLWNEGRHLPGVQSGRRWTESMSGQGGSGPQSTTSKVFKGRTKINGKLASLNIFLSKSAENSLPFFKTLKKFTKKSDFKWTTEAEIAFNQIKKLIAELPMLTAPKQMPIYFVSRALQGPKVNYTPMEKLILALVSASKRLKRCLQAHTIVVITDQPIKQMMSNPEVTGRLLKWRFELEEHDIHYRPKTSVNGQILANFIVERPEDDHLDTPMDDKEELSDPWILFTDGSSCIDGSGAGLIINDPEGTKFTYALRFMFNATNNEAEYEGLIADLRIAKQMGVKNFQANVDSKLVAVQVNRVYAAKESGMIKYLDKVRRQANAFKEFSIKQVPRGENKKAYALSKMASTSFAHLSKQEILPEEKRKARAMRRKTGRYVVTTRILYKKSFLGSWLRCVRPLQANYVLREIYEGSCSMYSGPRSVVAKALRSGYYWPTMHTNARNLIRECSSCQLEEISHVLWAHRTMIESSNGETPFSLTYGAEAVISVEIGMPTFKTVEVDMIKNDEALGVNFDLLEEKREQAAIQKARSKSKMDKYYNARVRNTSFRLGDLVYRNNEASHAKDEGKLGPKWEGPYEVTEALGKGAYKLRDHNGNTLLQTRNVCNLKKCYTHEM
nr:reverse transcriptase domain-containing protein [Tanacetum cinerariifolium]